MSIAAAKSHPPPADATPWRALDRELDAWAAARREATFWWRDDDAVTASPALDRLLALAEASRTPLALAVIPATADASLGRRLQDDRRAVVVQHGFAHRNHAPPGAKKAEFGPHRPLAAMEQDLAAGRARLRQLFGESGGLPVLVPPWNRIDPELVPRLPTLDFIGLSTFAARRSDAPGPPVRVNTHVDVADWEARRGGEPPPFVGAATALGAVVDHLAARRLGTADAEEPTGLLTHHLVMDQAAWVFIAALVRRSAGHPAARWLDPRQVFAGIAPAAPP